MIKARPINEWGLTRSAEGIVRKELRLWLKIFIKNAGGRTGNVFRADFIKDDFFFFTECNDKLLNNPESKGVEDALSIRRRKRMVLFQLFIRTLLGEKLGKILKCTHCGYIGERIEASKSLGGHFKYCPNCKKTTIVTYPNYYNIVLDEVKEYVKNNAGNAPPCKCKPCSNDNGRAKQKVR